MGEGASQGRETDAQGSEKACSSRGPCHFGRSHSPWAAHDEAEQKTAASSKAEIAEGTSEPPGVAREKSESAAADDHAHLIGDLTENLTHIALDTCENARVFATAREGLVVSGSDTKGLATRQSPTQVTGGDPDGIDSTDI